MINWKKEGYKVGEDVFIVDCFGYKDKKNFLIGKVLYVGTKNMKVSIKDVNRERILLFNGSRVVKGVFWNNYYCVYKSKEEYEQILECDEKASELRKHISDNLKKLSLDQLEDIKKIIDS